MISETLVIRYTGWNEGKSAEHWQIEVRTGGTEVGIYKSALDNLARNAVVRLYQKTTETV